VFESLRKQTVMTKNGSYQWDVTHSKGWTVAVQFWNMKLRQDQTRNNKNKINITTIVNSFVNESYI